MSTATRLSAAAQRQVYRRLVAEADAARIPHGSIPREEWQAFRRSPAGQERLTRQARANSRVRLQRRLTLAAYRREHPDATDAQAIAWLEA